MSDSSKAVFLSYASQDAEAAKRICDALRQAGVEVWFDQSELVGGDAWDGKIRKQIKECALFVPIISANTQARAEGYFRIEWRLADRRMEAMGKARTFLLPVCIDGTRDSEADVPDSFTTVQWTRLPGGETPDKFSARVKKLMGGEPFDKAQGRQGSSFAKASEDRAGREQETVAGVADPGRSPASPRPATAKPSRRWLGPVILLVAALAGLAVWQPWQRAGAPSTAGQPAQPAVAAAPLSEARKLEAQARALIDDDPLAVRENYRMAYELCERAATLSPDDGEIWATMARAHCVLIDEYRENSDQEVALARRQSERAMRLAPNSIESGLAMVDYEFLNRADLAPARRRALALLEQAPTDRRILRRMLRFEGTEGEGDAGTARRWAERANALPGGDARALVSLAWSYYVRNQFPETEATLERSLAIQPTTGAYQLKLIVLTTRGALTGDQAAARAWLQQIPPSILREDRVLMTAYDTLYFSRQPEEALKLLAGSPREILEEGGGFAPRGYLAGQAHLLGGKPRAAELEFQAALKVIEERLAQSTSSRLLIMWKARILARLGDQAGAIRQFEIAREFGRTRSFYELENLMMEGRHDDAIKEADARIVQSARRWPAILGNLKANPSFDPLRTDPRFQQIIARGVGWMEAMYAQAAANPSGETSTPPNQPKVDAKSVAVLAFANLSSDKEQEFFSDGISEEVLNVLAKVPGLKVSARTSAFYFKGRNTPIPEIAQQLGVAYVVEGSVQRAGDRVKITAQLIKAADGFHVWSDAYTRDMKDIFAVQDEIAAKIATSLTDKLGITLPVSAKTTPEAYTLYLQARATLAKRGVPNLREAVRMFDRVIAMDPDYLPARSGLAITLALLPAWTRSQALVESQAMINRAKQEARLVIERQPGSAEAWSALGLIYSSYDWRWQEAGEAVARSLTLAPNDAEIVNFAGDYYRLVLADPQTVETEKRAVELNPLQGVNHNDLAVCHLAFRQYELVIEPGRRAISIAPDLVENYDALFRAYGFLRRFDEMREVLAAARRTTPAGSAILANMEILAAIFEGRPAEALRLLEEFRPQVEQGGYSPAEYGYNYLRLGHPDKALPWLMLGVSGHDLNMVDRYTVDLDFVAAHPVTRGVLDDPSLKELMELRARHAQAAKAGK